MLGERNYKWIPTKGYIKIDGLPPDGWDDLTTEEQHTEIRKLVNGKELEL